VRSREYGWERERFRVRGGRDSEPGRERESDVRGGREIRARVRA